MVSVEDWSSRRDLILASLLEGPRSPKELAELTGSRRAEVETLLVSLKASGLVREEEVRGLLRRRTVYWLTEEGMREAREARERLERIAEEIGATERKEAPLYSQSKVYNAVSDQRISS